MIKINENKKIKSSSFSPFRLCENYNPNSIVFESKHFRKQAEEIKLLNEKGSDING